MSEEHTHIWVIRKRIAIHIGQVFRVLDVF